jgi:predicted nucleic acid-binding protein
LKAAYVDTSCLVAIAFGEAEGRGVADRLQDFERLVSSNLLEAELRAALLREGGPERPKKHTEKHTGKIEESLSGLLSLITWIHPYRRLTPEFRQVLSHGVLKGADLWHLACALFVAPHPGKITFLTLDLSQGKAARQLGFLS